MKKLLTMLKTKRETDARDSAQVEEVRLPGWLVKTIVTVIIAAMAWFFRIERVVSSLATGQAFMATSLSSIDTHLSKIDDKLEAAEIKISEQQSKPVPLANQ